MLLSCSDRRTSGPSCKASSIALLLLESFLGHDGPDSIARVATGSTYRASLVRGAGSECLVRGKTVGIGRLAGFSGWVRAEDVCGWRGVWVGSLVICRDGGGMRGAVDLYSAGGGMQRERTDKRVLQRSVLSVV